MKLFALKQKKVQVPSQWEKGFNFPNQENLFCIR